MKLKMISDTSYLLLNDLGEKYGIVIQYYDWETHTPTNIKLFTKDASTEFKDIAAMSSFFDEEIIIDEKTDIELNSANYKFIDDYPINDTDTIFDVQQIDGDPMKSFLKSVRSKKRFFPGWWVVGANGTYTARLTISTDTYKEKNGTPELIGPFRTYMEAGHEMKKIK